MESEIREQPAVLAANCAAYEAELKRALQGQEYDLIVLVARGSSDNAALYARYLFEVHLGIPTVLCAPSVLTRYGTRVRYPNALVVGISQSGAAADVAEVLRSARESGHTSLAMTNHVDSPVGAAAEFVLPLNSGVERSVAATKTYTCTLLALVQLARSLGAPLPDPGTGLPTDAWIETARESAEKASGRVVRSNVCFSLGRGYGFSTALECALKLMECALVPCKAYSTADFQHGPRALAGPLSCAILFGESVEGLDQQGCDVIQAPTMPQTVSDELRPLSDIVFGQWLALLAARCRAYDPDKPEFIEKVTSTY